MHASSLQGVLHYLRKLTDPARRGELSDADLLERFRLLREEAAFTQLVQRHGPMVLNVCRRILGDAHEAEDAFQATFLVLVRKASAIRQQQSLAGWLHRVALHLALRTRARCAASANGRRQPAGRPHQPADAGRSPIIHDDPSEMLAAAELRAVLDEEIERLPDKYRTPLVLCYLADKTHEQAARELGWPKSSVTARLARARQLLQQRLIRRGFTAPAGLLAMLLTEQSASAAIPSLLTLSTVRLAVQALSGETLTASSAVVLAGCFAKGATTLKRTAAFYLHDTASGKLIRKLKQSGDTTLHVVFSPDGRFLASMPQSRLAKKGEVSIWNLSDGKEVQRWTHPFSHAMSAAFSPDGKRLAIGGARWGLVMRDVQTGKEILRLSPHGGIYPVAFSPNGKILATQSPRGAIRLWDTATGKPLPGSVDPEMHLVDHLRFNGDGKRLFGDSGVCLAWDVATGCELLRFADPKNLDFKDPTDMHHLALSPDESLLAAVHPHEPIVLWEAASGKMKHTLRGDDSTWKLQFAPDGRQLISSGDKNLIHIWDTASGRELHRMTGSPALAVSPDARRLATVDTKGTTVIVCNLATGQETKRLTVAQAGMAPGSESLSHLAFAPDGRWLAAAGFRQAQRAITGGVIKLWDLDGREPVRSFDGGKMPIISVAFSPDGRTLAAGDLDGALTLWEVSSGHKRHTFAGHESRILALAFSPDGRNLAASSVDAPVYVWDVAGALQSNPRRLSNAEIQRGWSDLASEDAAVAFQAIRRLAAAAEQTPAFLRQQLKPAAAPDRKCIRQLVEMLDSAEFPVRQNAAEEVEKQSDAAAAILREILAKANPSLEVRRRLEQIVESIDNKPELLRAVRAVEVLEWIGTTEAVRLLGELANGAAEARLTREAGAAKRRLVR